MRIAYVGQMADVATENGISKKIRQQVAAWQSAGHDVKYFSLVPTTLLWPALTIAQPELVARGGVARRALNSIRLARRIRAWRPDVIYFRYAYHSPGFPQLFREIPTVAEINSDDLTEYPITLSPWKVAYHRLTRVKVLGAVSAFVPVTQELADRFAGFGKPARVIANSISLADFSVAPLPAIPPSLVFVGSAGTPWHGLERAGEIAALLSHVTVDVVGCTLADWRGPVPPPANLRFHGYLERLAYEPVAQRATAALGTLGLYLKRMDEACPLKVREYLALGIPVIAGYKDTDIPENADYFLRLPNNPASLAGENARLTAFCAHWQRRRVPRSAVAHLDTSTKETERLAFVAQIAQKRLS